MRATERIDLSELRHGTTTRIISPEESASLFSPPPPSPPPSPPPPVAIGIRTASMRCRPALFRPRPHLRGVGQLPRASANLPLGISLRFFARASRIQRTSRASLCSFRALCSSNTEFSFAKLHVNRIFAGLSLSRLDVFSPALLPLLASMCFCV